MNDECAGRSAILLDVRSAICSLNDTQHSYACSVPFRCYEHSKNATFETEIFTCASYIPTNTKPPINARQRLPFIIVPNRFSSRMYSQLLPVAAWQSFIHVSLNPPPYMQQLGPISGMIRTTMLPEGSPPPTNTERRQYKVTYYYSFPYGLLG